ncbi:hypothetical protein MOC12_20880 [Bacillus spizizenii]|nr:hypothetical protein [Bacillus spizizenii]
MLEPTKITEEQMIQLFREDYLLDDDDNVLFEVHESGEWADGGKFSDKEIIFKDVSTNKFYSYVITRSGSYFSYYEYEAWGKPVEVEKVEKTITIEGWVTV